MAPVIIGEAVKGYAHEIHGTDCQDNYLIIDAAQTGVGMKAWECDPIYGDLPPDIRIVAVADGHGSSKSRYSKTGSDKAVHVFCETMAEYVKKYREDMQALFVAFNREGEMTRISKWIVSDWESSILAHHSMRADLPEEEKTGLTKEDIWKLYGTTLLGMLITAEFLFAFQLGDGDIVFVSEKEACHLLESEKILGVETHSISKADSWKNVITRVVRLESMGERPYMCTLSTDGWFNSHLSEEEFYKTCRSYFTILREKGSETVKSNLQRWLYETSRDGCGDDITTIFVYFEENQLGVDCLPEGDAVEGRESLANGQGDAGAAEANRIVRGEENMNLETMYFTVEQIDGDYAHLRRTDKEGEETKLVARALLPDAIMEGTNLKYEMLQYEILD